MNNQSHGGPASSGDRLLLTEAQTAEMLSVSPRTLFGLRKAGKIAAGKIGSRVLYHIDEVRRFAADSIGKTIPVNLQPAEGH